MGVWGPKGMPPEIVAKLQAEIVKVAGSPEVKQRLAVLGFEPIGSTAAEFAKYIDAEMAKYGQIIRDAKIKTE